MKNEQELALDDVKQNGLMLEFIPEHLKTESMCSAAVNKHGYALKFVPKYLKLKMLTT